MQAMVWGFAKSSLNIGDDQAPFFGGELHGLHNAEPSSKQEYARLYRERVDCITNIKLRWYWEHGRAHGLSVRDSSCDRYEPNTDLSPDAGLPCLVGPHRCECVESYPKPHSLSAHRTVAAGLEGLFECLCRLSVTVIEMGRNNSLSMAVIVQGARRPSMAKGNGCIAVLVGLLSWGLSLIHI